MTHYILSFTVYTLAMSGLIFFALFVYKKVIQGSIGEKKSKILSVEETLSISPRKSLMIVKAGDERFLIASDIDKTSLISKLEDQNFNVNTQIITNNSDINSEKFVNNIVGLSNVQSNSQENHHSMDKVKGVKNDNEVLNKPNSIHLDVIYDKNLEVSQLRKIQRERKSNRNVSIDVGSTKDHGFATIKEMIHKVNEI